MLRSCPRCQRIHGYNEPCKCKRTPQTKTPDQALRSTSRWQKKREEIKDKSRWLCAVCLEEGIYNYTDLQVHHIQKLKDAPEKLLDDENLICLCRYHHEKADAGKISAEHLLKLARDREESQ